eukprot:CAMPEP_0172877226 /NCGR_PEP_ID=MMETSP1075-20121228/106430_1 /TAXON_ID=2916 /ORGANISM="Ceratium fusus, Strain PA161109" /LENGTH=44 /DNA_ID= /DNA_START= /DNA_END= /DNA_ORIENTATION=
MSQPITGKHLRSLITPRDDFSEGWPEVTTIPELLPNSKFWAPKL